MFLPVARDAQIRSVRSTVEEPEAQHNFFFRPPTAYKTKKGAARSLQVSITRQVARQQDTVVSQQDSVAKKPDSNIELQSDNVINKRDTVLEVTNEPVLVTSTSEPVYY